MLRLVDVDSANWRIRLEPSREQSHYVANQTVLLARAYAFRVERSRAFFVYSTEAPEGDTPVGMGLYYDCPEYECYDFSQLFIDARFQGRGYGRAATKLVLDELRADGRYNKVTLCYIEGNDRARRLYESLGFRESYRDEDEIIMELELVTEGV